MVVINVSDSSGQEIEHRFAIGPSGTSNLAAKLDNEDRQEAVQRSLSGFQPHTHPTVV